MAEKWLKNGWNWVFYLYKNKKFKKKLILNHNIDHLTLNFHPNPLNFLTLLTPKPPKSPNFDPKTPKFDPKPSYGRVVLAQHRRTSDLFAIKILKEMDNLDRRLREETEIVHSVDSEFVVKIYHTFKEGL
jgi:hypothetical protein